MTTEPQQLPIDLDELNETCLTLYKESIQRIIQTTCETARHTIANRIKHMETRLLNGETFYNYEIKEPTFTLCQGHKHEHNDLVNTACRGGPCTFDQALGHIVGVIRSMIDHYLSDPNPILHYRKVRDDLESATGYFRKMQDGEKLILFQKFQKAPKTPFAYLFVTNLAKILVLNYPTYGDTRFCEYEDLNFLIPEDYHTLLTTLIDVTGSTFHQDPSRHDNIRSALRYMKKTLSDRKFVPPYIKGIIDENQRLVTEHDTIRDEIARFNKERHKFEVEQKPFLDLIKDRADLDKTKDDLKKEKERLRLVALRLEMDRQKLDNDRRMVSEQLKEINKLDIDSILKSSDP